MSAWGRVNGVVSTGQLENADADMRKMENNLATRKAEKQESSKEEWKAWKADESKHEEASALLGSAGLEATEPVRKQHSRGFVLPGWPAVELLKYKVSPDTNHPSQPVEGTVYVQYDFVDD